MDKSKCLICPNSDISDVLNNNNHYCRNPLNTKLFTIIRHHYDDGGDYPTEVPEWCPYGHSLELPGEE